jgi:hypothetical protein
MKWNLLHTLFGAASVLAASAQDSVVINSLSQNGQLEWSGPTNGVVNYRVEWAPSVDGPWSCTWTNLANVAPTNTVLSVQVPMFYRVVAEQTPDVRLPGDTCALAVPVTHGTLPAETLMGYVNDYTPSNCLPLQDGADRVYVVDVPPGILLTASVVPRYGNPSIYLTATCGPSPLVCLAGDDSGDAETVNTVTYRNLTDDPQTVFIIIDSASASGPVPVFDLVTILSL